MHVLLKTEEPHSAEGSEVVKKAPGTPPSYLVGGGGRAAVLSQLQHGSVALAAGGTVEAVGPVIVDPLMVP